MEPMFLKIFLSHVFLYTYLIGSFSNRDHVSVMWEPQYNLEEKFNPAFFTEKRWNKAKHLNWNSIRLEFVKKTSMPNSVKGLGYIKGYSSGSLRSIKSPSNPIRYNYQKICSRWRSPKTILEIKTQWPHFSRCDQQAYHFQVFQTLLTTERILTRP